MNLREVIVVFALYACLGSANSEEDTEHVGLRGVTVFYTELYKALNRVDNFVFSPVSVETSMFLAYYGSRGKTRDAIQRVVWPSPSETPTGRYNNLTRIVRNSGSLVFFEPSKMFVSENFEISRSYVDTVKNKFLTDVESIHIYPRQVTADQVNNWVLNVTAQQIKNLIKKNDFSDITSVLMLSCVDFTGNWKLRFQPQDTKLQTFHLSANDTKQVQMMHLTNETFDVLVDFELDAKILVLPFVDKNYVLTIFLPRQRGKIEDMKNKLFESNVPVSTYVNKTTKRTVLLALPKFQLESVVELKDPLSKMGLAEMFSSNANFAGLAEKSYDEPSVNNIVQKAQLKINEDGIVGTIGTKTDYRRTRLERSVDVPAVIDFIIDHPFVFFLSAGADKSSLVDVFAGQVYDP